MADETPKDRGRVDRESLLIKPNEELDPLLFEKEKVFQLVLDSSRVMDDSRDSDIYGSQVPERAKGKRFSMYKETCFESLNTVDHLFVTGSAEVDSENFADLINQESERKTEKRGGKSNKKLNRLKETLRKDNGAEG